MTTNTFSKSGDVIIDNSAAVAAYAKLYFYLSGTTTPMTVYQDAAFSVPHTFPVICDQYGRVPPIYVNFTTYKTVCTTAEGGVLFTIDGQINPAPPSSGGGGGIIVSADMVHQTGDHLFLCKTGARSGWVRMNGRTIGNAASSATERANDDTEDLFAFYWNSFPQPSLASGAGFVSGGRGATAAADYAANKTIILLDFRGRVAVGCDDMGNTAAGVLQVSPTITTVSGSPDITVSSAAGLCIGQFCISANVPSGASITAISGTTVTLSANATASASGAAARFSFFPDAQSAGSLGGFQTQTLSIPQIPRITPSGTLSINPLNLNIPSTIGGEGSTAFPQLNAFWRGGGPSDRPITGTFIGAQFGGDQPHSNLQPSITGTWYQKL